MTAHVHTVRSRNIAGPANKLSAGFTPYANAQEIRLIIRTILESSCIIKSIVKETNNDQLEEDHKVIAIRLKHLNWQVRKRAYE